MDQYLPDTAEALREVRGKIKLELSPRLAGVLDLPLRASIEQVAAAVVGLAEKAPPQAQGTRELLAALALCGDYLADGFLGANNDELLLLGETGSSLVEELVQRSRPKGVRRLGEDLGLTNADFARYMRESDAVISFLAGLLDALLHAMYWGGWLEDTAARTDPGPHRPSR